MEGTKPRTANSLGMFDFLKGIGMLTIVFAHSAELYPVGATTTITPMTFYLFAYRESLMAAFYIASGYGFRKRSIGKCIDQQFKTLLKPYLYTGLATTFFHFLIHYLTFGSVEGAVRETLKVFGGFALGLPHTSLYAGQTFFSCGPMWYLLSLMIAWILLDVILNIFPEPYIPWAVLGTMLLGWGICITWEVPFCIGQGMVTVPALYVGYLAKQHKLFDRPLSWKLKLGMIASALAVAGLVLATQSTDCVSLGEWTMGPVSIFLDGAVGYGIIRLFLKWQRRVDGPISHAIEWVGRRSLFIFCIHTVELTAIPWYLMAAKYADRPVQGMLLQFVFSLASIFAITELLMRRKELGRKLRGGTKRDLPERLAAGSALSGRRCAFLTPSLPSVIILHSAKQTQCPFAYS